MRHTRRMTYTIESCEICGETHTYPLTIDLSTGVALFGGEAEPKRRFDVEFQCEKEGLPFSRTVVLEEGPRERIEAVHVAANVAGGDDWVVAARNEWVKDSGSAARGFSEVMLRTSIGAIPVYFVTMKYLGQEVGRPAFPGVLPPMMFFFSALLFFLALRPAFGWIEDDTDFLRFRNERLEQLNRRLTIASLMFGLATVVAVLTLGWLLHQA